jgi:Lipocalin-like domain
MKKIILLMMLVTLFGCKSKSVTNTKLDNKTESAIKGSWTIKSVTFPGSDYIKVSSFDIDDSKCFVGSNWSFVANNNTGNMELTNCSKFSSPITWYINKEGNFVMKVLNGAKAKKVVDGFILKVANQSGSSFQLIDNANVGGKMVEVVYQFVKN